MLTRILIFSAVAFLLTLSIQLRKKTPEISKEIPLPTPSRSEKSVPGKLFPVRTPASVGQMKAVQGPEFDISDKKNKLFDDRKVIDSPEEKVFNGVTSGSGYSSGTQSQRGPSGQRSLRRNGNSPSQSTPITISSERPVIAGPSVFSDPADPKKLPDPIVENGGGETSGGGGSSGGGGGGETDELSCSASVGNGSYSYAFDVSLTCSNSAGLRYCISENTCCDPETGATYSGPISINAGAGTYCLSFIGEADSDGSLSGVENRMYTLNPALPDLQVAHTKKYFQTTELEGVMNLSSIDFGNSLLSAGVINLNYNDPGPTGLNWTCMDIINEHSTLSSPATNYVMADTNATSFTPTSQVNVYLRTTNLSYGDNFLTSYLKNGSFVDPIVACSTTKIVLEDFPYFESLPYHGVAGTNDVREFSGGFTHLGFFEPEATVYRGPAGSDSETVSSQELETNIFGVFY